MRNTRVKYTFCMKGSGSFYAFSFWSFHDAADNSFAECFSCSTISAAWFLWLTRSSFLNQEFEFSDIIVCFYRTGLEKQVFSDRYNVSQMPFLKMHKAAAILQGHNPIQESHNSRIPPKNTKRQDTHIPFLHSRLPVKTIGHDNDNSSISCFRTLSATLHPGSESAALRRFHVVHKTYAFVSLYLT